MSADPGAASVEQAGAAPEVDYRFTLANERTFLAWIRTALGLLAGGVAVHTLVRPFHHAGVRRTLAMMCIVLAVILAVGAYRHWKDVGRRIARGEALRTTMMVPVLAAGTALVSVMAAVAVLYS